MINTWFRGKTTRKRFNCLCLLEETDNDHYSKKSIRIMVQGNEIIQVMDGSAYFDKSEWNKVNNKELERELNKWLDYVKAKYLLNSLNGLSERVGIISVNNGSIKNIYNFKFIGD